MCRPGAAGRLCRTLSLGATSRDTKRDPMCGVNRWSCLWAATRVKSTRGFYVWTHPRRKAAVPLRGSASAQRVVLVLRCRGGLLRPFLFGARPAKRCFAVLPPTGPLPRWLARVRGRADFLAFPLPPSAVLPACLGGSVLLLCFRTFSRFSRRIPSRLCSLGVGLGAFISLAISFFWGSLLRCVRFSFSSLSSTRRARVLLNCSCQQRVHLSQQPACARESVELARVREEFSFVEWGVNFRAEKQGKD